MAKERLPRYIRRDIEKALHDGIPDAQIGVLLHELCDAIVLQELPVLLRTAGKKTSCTERCSHCCRQSTIMIDEVDARILAERTGRNLHSTPSSRNWKGVACVFLDDQDRCSVYDYRPLTCRQSISVDDPSKCKTEEYREMIDVKLLVTLSQKGLNSPPFKTKVIASRGGEGADIRDFFPPYAV